MAEDWPASKTMLLPEELAALEYTLCLGTWPRY